MQTIRGFFNGNIVELVENPPQETESHVLITFLEGAMASAAATEQRMMSFSDTIRPPHFYGDAIKQQTAGQYRRFTAGALMTRDVVRIAPTDSVAQALHLMRQRGVTSILAEPGDDGEWGMMTIRDILSGIVLAERVPDEVQVSELATKPIVTVPTDTALRTCAELMIDRRIRRVIVSDNNTPVGIVSDTDIFQFVEERGWGPE